MKRASKYLLIGFAVAVLVIAFICFCLFQPPDDGRTLAERRQIADACFKMLNSSLTNEDDIKMDDPRIPKVIQALRPIGIIVNQNFSVQIDCNGKPAEYFLMRMPGRTNLWILCAAGPSIHFGPREVLRMEHD